MTGVGPAADVLTRLALSRGTLDRAGHRRSDPELVARLLTDPSTRVAVIVGDRMELVADPAEPTGHALALRPPAPTDAGRLAVFLGEELADGARTAYLAVQGYPGDPDAPPLDGSDGGDRHGPDRPPAPRSTAGWQTLRVAGLHLGDRDAGIFTTAQALVNWHAAHPFCSRCGAPTEVTLAGWLRRCQRDGSEHYPRTDPAVIMAVVDDQDRMLLGRSPHWPPGRFSVLAGFVEPGESFEAAVAREVHEEVGVRVTDVTYLGNQPWPFPSSGMIGFRARALDTELTLDPEEIAEARWVTRADYLDSLRSGELHTPAGISIAQRIIEHWLGRTVRDALA